jgi:hypothetical protein
VFEIDGGEITNKKLEFPPHHDVIKLPKWASSQGITDVIAYKVDKKIISKFAFHKINLYIGVKAEIPEVLIDDYINGRLNSDEQIILEITKI